MDTIGNSIQVLTTVSVVESSASAATGRAVGAPGRHHRARFRYDPRIALGWQWLCTSMYTASSTPRDLANPDDFLGPRYILLQPQSTKVHFLSRAPTLRGRGATNTIQ